MGALLAHVLPVALLAAVSPVMFLNAMAVRSGRGGAGSARFILGNALVLIPLGAASMGLLGASAASEATRQLASRRVDAVLAVVLLGYGLWALAAFVRKRREQRAAGGPAAVSVSRGAGLVGWGALGMITNLTSLPLFFSASQRIGASAEPGAAKIVLLALVIAIVLLPTWLPVVIASVAPQGRRALSERLRSIVTSATSLVSIGACLLGALLLAIHVLS